MRALRRGAPFPHKEREDAEGGDGLILRAEPSQLWFLTPRRPQPLLGAGGKRKKGEGVIESDLVVGRLGRSSGKSPSHLPPPPPL